MVEFGHLIVRSYLIHVYKLKKVTIGKDGKAQYYTEVLVCTPRLLEEGSRAPEVDFSGLVPNMETKYFPSVSLLKPSIKLQSSDAFYPRYKCRDSGVNTWSILDSTAIPPGSHPIYDPGLIRPFTHEWSSAVSLAAVHTIVFLEVSSTKHSSSKQTLVTLLTKPLG